MRAGLEVLDIRARSLVATVQNLPLDAADRLSDDEVRLAWQRALRLLVHKAILRREEVGENYRVALALYDLSAIIRELGNGGSECELNTPAQFVIAPNNFEDCGGHQTPFAPS